MKTRMSKRILCCIAVLLIITAFFSGCSEDKQNTKLPELSKNTIEASPNSFGARYRFTLADFTQEIAGDMEDMNLSPFPKTWETLSVGLVDDNGVKYTSFCSRVKGITFTAAVENDSGKVMNIGCGCRSDKLEDDVFREKFIRLAATLAEHAGGFEEEELDGLTGIFMMLMNGEEDTLYYERTLYIKSIDEETTVLMTAPCSEKITEKNKYQILGTEKD